MTIDGEKGPGDGEKGPGTATVRVAVAVPLDRAFDYSLDGMAELPRGKIVSVPFRASALESCSVPVAARWRRNR